MKRIANITAAILSAMIILQSVSLLLVDAGYNANHSYIASALCVNRAKPQIHCDGKCFLKKELSSQQEKESSSQKTLHPNSSITFFCEAVSIYNYFHPDRNYFLPRQVLIHSPGFLSTSEHPPTC